MAGGDAEVQPAAELLAVLGAANAPPRGGGGAVGLRRRELEIQADIFHVAEGETAAGTSHQDNDSDSHQELCRLNAARD
jgi:hypothetical protein